MSEQSPKTALHEALSKAPQATLMFWIVKICATTVGETGGDALSMSLKLGYAISTLIFLGFFVLAMGLQVRAHRYHPLIYWLVVVATTTVGTTTSDFFDRTMHFGYVLSSAILFGAVLVVLIAWKLTTGAIRADKIVGRKDEVFYWLTILVSNTLGTALGDFSADSTGLGLGFEKGAILFGVLILLVAVFHWRKWAPHAVLFWAAYVLTRPLGATLGDTLTKPVAVGGLNLDRFAATGVIVVVMIVLVLLSPGLRRPASAAT